MLLFGHIGITLGAATLLSNLLPGKASTNGMNIKERKGESEYHPLKHSGDGLMVRSNWWFSRLNNYLDIRFLLVGSMLPDIIDKPVGHLLFRETFSSGRIFSHSLLFNVLVALPGLYLYRRYRKNWLAALAAGSVIHLLLDQMWQAPRTLFWPFQGLAFDRADVTGWFDNLLQAMVREPAVFVPELIGIAVLLLFGIVLLRRKMLLTFLRHGQLR
ncbi:MAG TPA: metal-dependent hydrolase [Dehalococcoidia bacterium]|nr:metal-dependent hydrolase [Dehalococcoidia bacterium]